MNRNVRYPFNILHHLFIFLGVCIISNTHIIKTEISYAELAPLYAGLPEEQKISSEFKQLSEDEQRALVFKLFSKTPDDVSIQPFLKKKEDTRLKTVIHDLNLFKYNSKDVNEQKNHLFHHLNHTSTLFGQVTLAHMLANPIKDVEVLRKRQKIIKLLVENPALFDTLSALVKRVKKYQKALLINYTDMDTTWWDGHQRAILFNRKLFNFFNTNASANQFFTYFDTDIIGTLISMLLIRSSVSGMKEDWNHFLARSRQLGTTSMPQLTAIVLQETSFWQNSYVLNVNLISVIMFVYKYSNHLKQVYNVTHDASLRVQGMSQIERTITQVYSVLKKYKHSMNPMRIFDKHVLGHMHDIRTQDWHKRLRSFNDQSTFGGEIRSTYYLAREHKEQLIESMKVIGEIDAYLSIAKLYKKYQNHEARYSFVNFDSTKEPLTVEGFWNPMLSPDKAVVNDISLGGSNARSALVTGSNTGGKSTIMINGLLATIYLAQTIGIAPARAIQMNKPFSYIGTLLKVQDNVAQGQSHYAAEVAQAARVYKELHEIDPQEHALLFVDELFEGTIAHVGAQALYNFAQKLMHIKNLTFLMVTQYRDQILDLAPQSNGICKNYRIDVIKNPDGSIHRPHKIEEGVSRVTIGEDLFKQAFEEV